MSEKASILENQDLDSIKVYNITQVKDDIFDAIDIHLNWGGLRKIFAYRTL